MFSNAILFRLPAGFAIKPADLEEALQSRRFLSCGPIQAESSGWIAPRGEDHAALVEVVGGQIIVKLQLETKVVPGPVLARKVDEKIKQYQSETGNECVGKKLKAEFKEEALQALLPHAFARQSATLVWIDPVNHLLVVDSGSLSGADKVLSALVEAFASIPGALPLDGAIRPVLTQSTPGSCMAHWLVTREAPHQFSVDRACVLKASDESKASVRYVNHALDIDEVVDHVKGGKVPTQLALTWRDRMSFVLGDLGQLGRIALCDGVLDNPDGSDDGFEADVAIATGELSVLIPDLLEALGGELGVTAE